MSEETMTGGPVIPLVRGDRTSAAPGPSTSVQGTLALGLVARVDPPPVPQARRRPGADVVPIDRARRRELETWSWRYAQAVVEVVSGDRPVTQLLRWTAPDVYRDLARRAQLVGSAGGHAPGQGRRQPGPRHAVRPQVLGVRTSFVAADAAESSIHVRYGARSRAIASRFEVRGGRWQCAALEFA